MIWYEDNKDGIIVSTRVRLARNLAKYPFPIILSDEGKKLAAEEIEKAVFESNSTISQDFKLIKMSDISGIEKLELAEKHLISPDMAKKNDGCVLISSDKNMSIMLMEEDHIRMQIILPGSKIKEAWELADKVDSVIGERAEYAFSEEFGFLTACPTNTGTGMRASVMMHLPALAYTKNINKIISSASALGLTVRGLYGEGSKAFGNLYQISNQITLGISEEEIIEKLENIVSQIERHEIDARNALKDNKDFTDKLWRSYGILKYARKISSEEAKSYLSDVILGQNLGIIDIKGKMPLIRMIVETEPAHIMKGENISPDQRDERRAEFLRENI